MFLLRTVGAAFLAAVIPATAFVRYERSAGVPMFQRVPEAVAYRVHAGTAAGMRNTAGALTITEGSTPTAAILAAFATWSAVEGARVAFAAPEPQADPTARADGVNTITFADTPSNRAMTSGALAITRLFSDFDGALTDTDVLFNPEAPFSTTLEAGTFDIQGVLTHELGHALGMDHSGSATATMFATTTRGSKRLRRLSEDDKAFLRAIYPAPGAAEQGGIEGVVRSTEGAAVAGAVVTAFDAERNRLVSAMTGSDGRYQIGPLEPGAYGLVVEPLDGPAEPFQLAFTRRNAHTVFRTRIDPGPRVVTAGALVQADLAVEMRAPVYNLTGLSAAKPGLERTTRVGALVERGETYEVALDGVGLEDAAITLASLRMLGTGIEILPTRFERDRIRLSDGRELPRLTFAIRVRGDAPLGAVSLALATGAGEAAFTAGFEIVEADVAPVFDAHGLVNAASFAGGPAAPGGLLSLFGKDLAAAAAPGALDPITGRIVDLIGDVSVRFNGRPAALLYVSPGQINMQAPPELAPGRVTLTVDRNGVRGEATIDVAASAPGLFAGPGGGTLALLLDGSLNTPQRPVRRGDYVALFGAGAGAVTPALGVGELAPLAPLSWVDGAVQAEIGGRPAEVQFAGMAPGYAGLLQVNVRVPEDAPAGPAVPLLLRIGGAAAPIGSLSVE